MKRRALGKSGLDVSVLALGCMTFGEDNDERSAHRLLDLALERGVTLFDTAELYPVPPRADTAHASERIVGSWLRARRCRDRVVLATKVVGPLEPREGRHIRGGTPRLDRRNISAAIDGCLSRLGVDHVDLFQLHWPERSTNYFGRLGYIPDANEDAVPIEETLEALAEIVAGGKARAIGVSNETPWGLMRFVRLAEERGLPRVASIQNPYNLLNRTFDIGLAEVAHREDVPLLAYSPTCFGILSGKYLDDPRATGKVKTRPDYFFRYSRPEAEPAVRAYVGLAKEAGLLPEQMALAFVSSRPFVASTILGATTEAQLERNLGSDAIVLEPDLLVRIEEIFARHQSVCP